MILKAVPFGEIKKIYILVCSKSAQHLFFSHVLLEQSKSTIKGMPTYI